MSGNKLLQQRPRLGRPPRAQKGLAEGPLGVSRVCQFPCSLRECRTKIGNARKSSAAIRKLQPRAKVETFGIVRSKLECGVDQRTSLRR